MIMFGIFPNIWRMFVEMMEGAAHELTSPPFDVRNGIPEAELDDESIQLLYDAVNRMVVLIGEIPSSRLFLAPICEIGLLVAPRVTIAARYGLLREPALVEQLIGELVENAGNATIGGFFVHSRGQVAPETSLVVKRLDDYE